MGRLRKIGAWLEDRTGLAATVAPLLTHTVPPDTGWWYIFGSATLVAFLLQVLTGTILALSYIPSTAEAYATLQWITNVAPFGRVLRGMHYFGASAMVFLVGVHAFRVFLTASYKFPREVNWLTGVVLLLLTMIMGFTGQLLRWDDVATWSVVVAAEQAARVPFIGRGLAHFIMGGEVLGGSTLSRFFAAHVFFFPGLIFAFVAVHLYLVIRNGISERPSAIGPTDRKTYRKKYDDYLQRRGVPFWPDAAWRDVVFSTAVVAMIVTLAVVFGPPQLGAPPDPAYIKVLPRPDWYLLWYFALLALSPHAAEPYIMVLFPVIGIVILLAIPFIRAEGERSPRRRPWAIATVLVVCGVIGSLWRLGSQSPWSPDFDPKPLAAQVIGASTGPVYEGAQLFQRFDCIKCHAIAGVGGHRGPDLTTIGSRLNTDELKIRILNGGYNMPAYAQMLTADQVALLATFLGTRQE